LESLILTEVRDNVGILTLNRPRQFNSLSLPMLGQLVEALAALERDPLVRCALIQAEGKHFCTGADLDEVQALRGSVEALEHFLATGEHLPAPQVGEIHGVLRDHVHELYDFYGEYTGLRVARKHISWYSKGQRHGGAFRQAVTRVEEAGQQLDMVQSFFAELIDNREIAA
jgi:tRNA-dihydrouridine synthase